MQEELLQFQIQKVWILVDFPFGKKEIRTKWVYSNKKDERGVVVRNKARLVAQGHRQDEGIDYDEVFSPVARIEAIRIILAFASYMGFIVYQMDVKSAFLYGTIDEEVYVTQPLGFVDLKFPNKKSGYRREAIDKTLFIKQDQKDIMLVQVYMDDIIFCSKKKYWCDESEELIKNRFQMSSMGELTFFLGLQVKQKEDGIFISQDKYVTEILKKFDFLSVKTTSTPIETQKPLVKDEEVADVDVYLYSNEALAIPEQTAAGVNTPRCDEDSLELNELMVFFVQFVLRKMELELLLIVDFLNAQVIQYALMVNPTIYVSCIKQFWATVLIKKVKDVVKLQALIDRKKGQHSLHPPNPLLLQQPEKLSWVLKRMHPNGGRIKEIDADEEITLVDIEIQGDLGAELLGRLEEKDEVNVAAQGVNVAEPIAFVLLLLKLSWVLKRMHPNGERIKEIDADEEITLVDIKIQGDLGAELLGRLEEKDEVNVAAQGVNVAEPIAFDDEEDHDHGSDIDQNE
nr:copia protein [Tanacetum cinerariifolium]